MIHNPILLVFVILAFFLVLTVITARIEKRMVCPYGELAPEPPYQDIADYGKQWVNKAVQSGFIFLGWAADSRTPHYRLNYAFLASPERDCLFVICCGNIFKLNSRSTVLHTRTADGKVYYTSEQQNGVHIDLIGHWMSQLAPVKTFPALLERHQDLLRIKNAAVQHFTPGRELDEFKQMRKERYETLARRGLIVYTDRMDTSWHYTLWGSLRYTFINFTIGIIRAKTNGRMFRCK
jgi:hypothetical protein